MIVGVAVLALLVLRVLGPDLPDPGIDPESQRALRRRIEAEILKRREA